MEYNLEFDAFVIAVLGVPLTMLATAWGSQMIRKVSSHLRRGCNEPARSATPPARRAA
jgi:hypothetical protein